ncbi:MAG TPA: helix-turn-helix domain-containing protein [Candidatus Thermoplasmatota archaeon]|nr:helix-turn-helix domain-containing protein [Candidatus Thermoplasmatota archaeon]
MMPRLEPGLAKRLDMLTGDGDACALEFRALAAEVRREPRFRSTLSMAKAMADERRLLALALLDRRDALCACELQAALGVSHATVSHHMDSLAAAGLVASERRGKWTYYRLTPAAKRLVPRS